MLTAYDQYAAQIFDEAGIPVLLVGDSAANNVLGYENTVPVTVDELIPFVRAVVTSTRRALVVADLPFGSYEASPQQALETGVRFLKEGGAQAVKLEGGRRVVPQVEALVDVRHPGDGPPRAHARSRSTPSAATASRAAARPATSCCATPRSSSTPVRSRWSSRPYPPTSPRASPRPSRSRRSASAPATAPTPRCWCGRTCSGSTPSPPKFVRPYADLRSIMSGAVQAWADDVRSGTFPDEEHSYR